MPAPALDPAIRRALISAFGFWADAGVDATYAEAPQDRLAATPRAVAAARGVQETLPAPVARAVATAPPSEETAELLAALARHADLGELLAAAQQAGFSLLLNPVERPLAVLLVEAPDRDDQAEGRLLAGGRGRLFAQMAAACGLDGRVSVAAGRPLPAGGGGRSVAGEAAYAAWLERALTLCGPIPLLAAGAEAVGALTGESVNIFKAHGRLQAWRGPRFGAEMTLVPTFSLETLLAQPHAKARAWRDILTLRTRVDSVASGP